MQNGFLPNSVGQGWGFDLGASALFFNKLKVGLAVTNIGSITWDGNLYQVNDTLFTQTSNGGLDNYNVSNTVNNLSGEQGLLSWSGAQSRTVSLPTTIRLGASMRFGKRAELGLDIIMPGNDEPGNMEKAIIGFGGDLKVLPFLKIQAGYLTGGNYGNQVPVGLLITPPSGRFEAGIASRDAVTFFTQNGPTLSLSFGFMRFRI